MDEQEPWFWIRLVLICAIVIAVLGALGMEWNVIDNQLFNTSPTHLGAVAQKFSDDCLQLAEAKDPTTKKAIEQDIY